MKTLMVVLSIVCATTLQAAYTPKQWQTNEVALLPKKPFGGIQPVLLLQEIPRLRPLGYRRFGMWKAVPLENINGTLKWNFNKILSIKTRELSKFPLRKRTVVETWCIHKDELYWGKTRQENEAPFIKPE